MTTPLRYLTPLLLLVIGTLQPPAAHAWGGVGHEIVCEIAFDELTDQARREVIRLMRQDSEYETFREACNWPDRPRTRDIEHYLNVPRSIGAITVDDCPLAEACVLSAITNDIRVLEDDTSSDARKLAALKYLGHWVGDIHQPMHVSHQDDRGANSIEVSSDFCEGTLHGAWDYCLVERGVGTNADFAATRLRLSVTSADREAWIYDSPVEWADESYQIAVSPAAEYCYSRSGACWYDVDNMLLQREEEMRTVVIDDAYVAAHRATVERRLTQAGVRLGAVLNRLLR